MTRKIAIADDHSLVREVAALYIAAQMKAEVRQAGTIEELEGLIEREGFFDLILLDLVMPGMQSDLAALARVVEKNNKLPVVLFSGNAAPHLVREALAKGAAGYIEKSQTARSLLNAIDFILAGEVYLPISFRLQTAEVGMPNDKGLTPKELQVLRSLTSGLMNKEIALDLGISEVTVKMHVRSICAKLKVRNRTQAAMMGAQFILEARGSAQPSDMKVLPFPNHTFDVG